MLEYFHTFGTFPIKVGLDVKKGFLRVRRRT